MFIKRRHKWPAMTYIAEEVPYGYLMSYGQDLPDYVRRAVAYVDKILKGANPADLPVEQPTKLKLVLNLKTAKALGLTFPQTLVVSADEVIGDIRSHRHGRHIRSHRSRHAQILSVGRVRVLHRFPCQTCKMSTSWCRRFPPLRPGAAASLAWRIFSPP
jgi:hypothetical protein